MFVDTLPLHFQEYRSHSVATSHRSATDDTTPALTGARQHLTAPVTDKNHGSRCRRSRGYVMT